MLNVTPNQILDTYCLLLHFHDVNEQVFQDTYERRCSNAKTNKQQDIIFSVILCWSSVRSIY